VPYDGHYRVETLANGGSIIIMCSKERIRLTNTWGAYAIRPGAFSLYKMYLNVAKILKTEQH